MGFMGLRLSMKTFFILFHVYRHYSLLNMYLLRYGQTFRHHGIQITRMSHIFSLHIHLSCLYGFALYNIFILYIYEITTKLKQVSNRFSLVNYHYLIYLFAMIHHLENTSL